MNSLSMFLYPIQSRMSFRIHPVGGNACSDTIQSCPNLVKLYLKLVNFLCQHLKTFYNQIKFVLKVFSLNTDPIVKILGLIVKLQIKLALKIFGLIVKLLTEIIGQFGNYFLESLEIHVYHEVTSLNIF